MGHEKIQFYEVAEGGIVNDRPYTGLILREEMIYNADNSGISTTIYGKAKGPPWVPGLFSGRNRRLDSLLRRMGENQTLSDETWLI